jgi:hypothetical protein
MPFTDLSPFAQNLAMIVLGAVAAICLVMPS